MVFVKVALTKDLEPDHMVGVEAGGKEVVVANLDGTYYAIGNRCTHMGCMLSDGTLKRENATCPCHGSIFNIRTGSIIKGPAKNPEPVFPTKTEAEQILADV